MNQEVNLNNKRKRLKLYYGLLITVVCIIGVSFAWFRLYLSQSEDNTLASRTCFSTTLTEDTSKITLTDAFPISDEDGLKQTPFTFTLKNNCSSYVKVYITIDSTYRTNTSASYLKDTYMKVNVSPKDTTDNASVILGNQTLTDLENNKKGYILLAVYLSANEEKSFDLRIWMDSETTIDQGLNKNWAGKIVAISNASETPPISSLTIKKETNKTSYLPGENFDSTGLILNAIREDGSSEEITEGFTIIDGNNLQIGKEYVEIEYNGIIIKHKIKILKIYTLQSDSELTSEILEADIIDSNGNTIIFPNGAYLLTGKQIKNGIIRGESGDVTIIIDDDTSLVNMGLANIPSIIINENTKLDAVTFNSENITINGSDKTIINNTVFYNSTIKFNNTIKITLSGPYFNGCTITSTGEVLLKSATISGSTINDEIVEISDEDFTIKAR